MAKPIKITPVLRGNDAVAFHRAMKQSSESIKNNSDKVASKFQAMKDSFSKFEKSFIG